jgi:hypothetical protein
MSANLYLTTGFLKSWDRRHVPKSPTSSAERVACDFEDPDEAQRNREA